MDMSYSLIAAYNSNFERASRVADMFISFVEGFAHAVASGAEVIDLRETPNAQPSYALTDEAAQRLRDAGERLPRRVSPKSFDMDDLRAVRVTGYPTRVTTGEVMAMLASLRALHGQARVLARLVRAGDERAEDIGTVVLDAQRAVVDSMRALDPSLWEVATREFDKAHVADFNESADLKVKGFHWTASDKGSATTIRYADGKSVRSNNKADQHYAAHAPAQLDEDAMAEALAA